MATLYISKWKIQKHVKQNKCEPFKYSHTQRFQTLDTIFLLVAVANKKTTNDECISLSATTHTSRNDPLSFSFASMTWRKVQLWCTLLYIPFDSCCPIKKNCSLEMSLLQRPTRMCASVFIVWVRTLHLNLLHTCQTVHHQKSKGLRGYICSLASGAANNDSHLSSSVYAERRRRCCCCTFVSVNCLSGRRS